MSCVKRAISSGLVLGVLLPLGACANSPLAESLERTFAADPRLESSPAVVGTPSPTPDVTATPELADLPVNFPVQPYANAELIEVTPPDTQTGDLTQTRWQTPDSGDRVRQFYQDAFEAQNWTIVQSSDTDPASLVAERDGVQVTLAIAPPLTPSAPTEFTLTYGAAADPSAEPTTAAAPQPGDPEFIGPILPPDLAAAPPDSTDDAAIATPFTDLDQAPEELRSHIADLAQLGVLNLSADGSTNPSEFKPNQVVTRREFARWLVAANNKIYGDRPANRIRLGVTSAQPAFQDVPTTDPDFAAIQGLAEAGLIPSPLSGDATTVTFRPDAPLTRESLVLWKTPVDLRQTLPNASIEAVQQTWGFQDAARIDPKALRAVLADFQNGDASNIRRAFGYTTLFQPKKTVTRAEAAAVLWFFGAQGDGVSAQEVLQRGQSQS